MKFCKDVWISKYVHVHTHSLIHYHTYMHTLTYTHMMHGHTHIHTHTHTHTHTHNIYSHMSLTPVRIKFRELVSTNIGKLEDKVSTVFC